MRTEQQLFDTLTRDLPSQIDSPSIRDQWLALRAPYHVGERHLPLPNWARRGFTDSGEQAWHVLNQEASQIDINRAFCIYIHVPFCSRRCSFCDCYSFKLKSHREDHFHRYTALLEQEMGLWHTLGTLAHRPVSTVHFGGGTPTFLDPDSFRRCVQACRSNFTTSPQTEWALESTSSELTPEILTMLHDLGFTRLHVGVQSLDTEVRRCINRQETGDDVLHKLQTAIEMGWIVSVDIIFGLPGQTPRVFLDDLDALIRIGVDGFSLYELQLSHRNRHFAREYGITERPRVFNYVMAQVGGQFLAKRGFRKTLFNHFAGMRDTNLYFTFPERGEDCLALGTIADGVMGDYHYRHPTYAPYTRSVTATFPGLQGGLRRNAREEQVQPLTTALLSGRVPVNLLAGTLSETQIQQWFDLRLLDADPGGHDAVLTGNGSWFVGNMIASLVNDPGSD